MRRILLFLSLIIILNNNSIFSQFDIIQKFPLQDSTATHGSSAIIPLTDNKQLFFWTENNKLFLVNNEGSNYYNKRILIENIFSNYNYKTLSVLKTNTNRIILVYTDNTDTLSSIISIFSDDEGISWSNPNYITSTIESHSYMNPSLSQTRDGTIWLLYNQSRNLYSIKSNDYGISWNNKILIDNSSYAGSLISDNTNLYYLFYTKGNYNQDTSYIYYKISPDSGNTWQKRNRISYENSQDFSPCAFITKTSKINLLFVKKNINLGEYNLNFPYPYENLDYELCYITSSDNCSTWSKPKKFTKYAGYDYLSNLTFHNDIPFVTFLSTRTISEIDGDLNKPQIWFGILEHSVDKITPPVIQKTNTIPVIPRGDTSTTFTAMVYDNELMNVQLIYSLNGIKQEPISMNDQGLNGDKFANDSIYSFGNNNFDLLDQVEYYIKASDISKNITRTKKYNINFLYPYVQDYYNFDINNFKLPINNYGILADISIYDSFGNYIFSGGQFDSVGFLYSGGFALSGLNNGNIWGNGIMSASRIEDYLPGTVDNSVDTNLFKIYLLSSNSLPFSSSWITWENAVKLGAKFYDGNGDGVYNPIDLNNNGRWDSYEDRPDIIGDVTAWCVYNDSKPSDQRRYQNIDPQGIEIKQTVFAYSPDTYPKLSNVIFIRYNIENKGTVTDLFDSVYFSAWTDPDLGDYEDDVVGSDTTVNSGYCYNNQPDGRYGNNPPAFFISLLQGPAAYIPNETFLDVNENNIFDENVDTPLDSAKNNLGLFLGYHLLPGSKNQEMTSSMHYISSDPTQGDPYDEFGFRNYILGKKESGNFIDPCNWYFGEVFNEDCLDIPPQFIYSGDPVTKNGWLCKIKSDHRLMVNSGPFKLEKEKPQEIIIAYVVGRGIDYFNSVTVTRQITREVIGFYESNFTEIPVGVKEVKTKTVPTKFVLEQNYPNPFNPTTTIKYQIPNQVLDDNSSTLTSVRLTVYDVLGRGVITLVNQKQKPGAYEINFDANKYSSGVYYYQLKVGKFIQTKKMILLK